MSQSILAGAFYYLYNEVNFLAMAASTHLFSKRHLRLQLRLRGLGLGLET